jgi:hypothetical protein
VLTRTRHRSPRKSSAVPLILAASTILSGCGSRYVQDEYASREDCIKDWERPELCQQRQGSSSGSSGSSGGSGRYLGPQYEEGQRESAQRNARIRSGFQSVSEPSNRSIGRSVSRGGFGGLARGFSSGG